MSLKFDTDNVPYVDFCNYSIRLETNKLPPEYKEKAMLELRDTPENVANGINELRNLLKEETALSIPIDDDEFLIKFLKPCKYYSKSAFDRIVKYYKFRLKHIKICKDLVPNSVRHVFEQEVIHFQPLRDQFGRRILILEVGKKWNPSVVTLNDFFRSMQISLEAAMIEPMTQVNGVVVIMDMEGLSLGQILHYTPSFAAMALDWVQHCVATRLKAVHIVYNSYLFNMLFQIFKPFIQEKLRKRIYFHGKNPKSILMHIDADRLRPRYLGTLDAPVPSGKLFADLMECYHEDFELANTFGFTETKQ